MQNFKALGEELKRSGKAEGLKNLAESADGQKISRMLNMDAVEKAAREGNAEAMQSIVKNVLQTDEGKRLAESLVKLMQD